MQLWQYCLLVTAR